MKLKIPSLEKWCSLRGLSVNLILMLLLFQVLVMTRATFLYTVIKIVFIEFVILLLAAFIRRAAKQKMLVFGLLLIILIRVPFYFHPNGLLTTADNATEALQSVEMQASHAAPFFLLDRVKHMGTIKYLCIAFLNDFFGPGYLPFVLLQLVLFIAFLLAVQEFFKLSTHKTVLLFFFLTNFAFIENLFDFSLSIRGAPYLDMVFFFVLGAILFDFSFDNGARLFLAYYFMFFSIYIHPLSALFVFGFLACALIFSLRSRRFIKNAAFLAAGMLAGLFHWFYYLLFEVKPVSTGAWEKIDFIKLSQVSFGFILGFFRNFWQTFRNIFDFEFSYFHNLAPAGTIKTVLLIVSEFTIYLSAAVFAAATIIVFIKIVRLLAGKDALETRDWTKIFYFFLLGAVLFKIFVFYPPHQEPRHNFDLMFLIMAAYLIVFSRLFRGARWTSWKPAVAFLVFLAMTAPHAVYYFKNVVSKEASYAELMSALARNKVRFLTTDFIIAYPVYYFSQRRILVSDSLGPYSVSNFYPEMRAEVDKVPRGHKAYVFYSESYPSRPWHKQATRVITARIVNNLNNDGIPFKTVRLKDFVLIIPSPKTGSPETP